MKSKKEMLFPICVVIMTTASSCSHIFNSETNSLENDSSSLSNSRNVGVLSDYLDPYKPEESEEFDPNKSYLGMDSYDFSNMAIKYTFCQRIQPLSFSKNPDRVLLVSNGRTYSFRFGDEDVFAVGDNKASRNIELYSKTAKKLFTISEAREEGFFKTKKTDSWPIYFWHDRICESNETFWVSEKKNGLDITQDDYFTSIQKYGAWDAMMVFLDLGSQYYGTWPNGISSTLWPAIPIYSDDYSEVLGASVLDTNLEFRTYLKEDGYADKITMEQYEAGIRKGKADHSENFGRAAFYFEPSEFVSPGPAAYYNLLGGEVVA